MDIKKTIAVVQYPSGYKNYDFLNHVEDLEVGDTVITDSSNGLSIAKVVSFKESSTTANKWIVQKVNLTAHRERVAKQTKVNALRKKMEQRRKEIQDIQIYAMLAKSDPTMNELLNEMLSLEGKA